MTAIFFLHRRAETDRSTRGDLFDPADKIMCQILERGPRNAAHPRIPAGTYQIGRRLLGESHFDDAFRQLLGAGTYKGILWLPEVPGRTNIEIHTANRIEELLGCLATGQAWGKDREGDFMVLSSRPAYRAVYPIISAEIDNGGAQLVITDPDTGE